VIAPDAGVVMAFAEETSPEIMDRIFEEFNSLSVVYRRPASSFVKVKWLPACGIATTQRPGGCTTVEDSETGTWSMFFLLCHILLACQQAGKRTLEALAAPAAVPSAAGATVPNGPSTAAPSLVGNV
jgi:hypothetical protein